MGQLLLHLRPPLQLRSCAQGSRLRHKKLPQSDLTCTESADAVARSGKVWPGRQHVHKSSKIAAQLDLSVDSAHELLKKAMAGDDEARARIRKARQDGATMTGTTEALAAEAA